jgi:hypothetical protein
MRFENRVRRIGDRSIFCSKGCPHLNCDRFQSYRFLSGDCKQWCCIGSLGCILGLSGQATERGQPQNACKRQQSAYRLDVSHGWVPRGVHGCGSIGQPWLSDIGGNGRRVFWGLVKPFVGPQPVFIITSVRCLFFGICQRIGLLSPSFHCLSFWFVSVVCFGGLFDWSEFRGISIGISTGILIGIPAGISIGHFCR